ncbi:helix-turn-helix transcriptional regulator [Phaeobacter inhibens]|uniref:helix-turn-helix transcriptional regulator n=1 Tax=Phaeobacter inhibens TaxID=221822 RepID=UPI0021A4889E|nr:LuxR family transcriptional regulator [Phaeobacter inhibens]UWR87829.1 LuxR family transcriptional regulator [Phaeobacter inhibens]
MNLQLLDFVEQVGSAPTAELAGQSLIAFSCKAGAKVVHAFMGTGLDHFRATTLPGWAVEFDCAMPGLLTAHTVAAVRSGQPRVLWGEELDRDNPRATDVSRRLAQFRKEHFGQNSSVSFAMPDADGRYRGGGVGLGFEDQAAPFLQRMKESCGALAVASFAAHSRMLILSGQGAQSSPLSKRQGEILQLLAAGFQLGAIADRLGIADTTVNFHLAQLKKKLNVKTKEQALAMAVMNDWVRP